MRTGFGAVKDSLDRQKAKSSGGGGGWLNYLTWRDGDRHIVRFLTDDVITCGFYEFVDCNDGKKHDFIAGNTLGADVRDYVAQFNPQTRERGANGPLVPAIPRERTVGMVVLREEQPDKSITDVVVEKEIGGVNYVALEYRIIRQGLKNFWSTLVGYHARYGTICDRDYEITPRGDRLDTTYNIIPLDPVEELRSAEAVADRYGYGKPPAEGEEKYLFAPMTLKDWCLQQASEDRAARWLGGGAGGADEAQSGWDPAPSSAPAADAVSPGGTQFANSLRDRLAGKR